MRGNNTVMRLVLEAGVSLFSRLQIIVFPGHKSFHGASLTRNLAAFVFATSPSGDIDAFGRPVSQHGDDTAPAAGSSAFRPSLVTVCAGCPSSGLDRRITAPACHYKAAHCLPPPPHCLPPSLPPRQHVRLCAEVISGSSGSLREITVCRTKAVIYGSWSSVIGRFPIPPSPITPQKSDHCPRLLF